MVNLFVKIIIFIIIIKMLFIIEIIGRYFENFLNCLEKLFMVNVVRINGIVSLKEYIISNKIFFFIEFMFVV